MRPAMSSRTFVQGLLFFISLCAALLPSTVRAQELTCPPCSDGNLCTSDSCDTTTGTCRFETALCDDANPCTYDQCTATFYEPGGNGGCWHFGVGQGVACDDGNPCTSNTTCQSGNRCVGPLQPEGTACDDGNPCTVEDACSATGACLGTLVLPGTACDDHNPCTTGETCQQTASGSLACEGTATECPDPDACTLGVCNPATGACETRTRDCSDGNVCTVDSCDPSTGCVRTPTRNGSVCEFDGSLCTTDFCQDGNCFPGPGCPPNGQCYGYQCDPLRGCLYSSMPGTCSPNKCTFGYCVVGQCLDTFPKCYDGNACTLDVCDPQTGTCSFPIDPQACNDNNPCTVELCSPEGGCTFLPIGCDDGNICTLDSCDPATGQCVHVRSASGCDDRNPCTLDSCDLASGCQYAPNDGVACEDGNLCTRGEVCKNGVCGPGSPIFCDDGNPCTLDACDPRFGCMSHVDPSLPDVDADGVPDACDNCPTIANPSQDPSACEQSVVDIFLRPLERQGRVVKLLSWRTTHEVDVAGYNVVTLEIDGTRTPLNRDLILCTQCGTGAGASYSFRIRGRERREVLFVELVHQDGQTGLFGPAMVGP